LHTKSEAGHAPLISQPSLGSGWTFIAHRVGKISGFAIVTQICAPRTPFHPLPSALPKSAIRNPHSPIINPMPYAFSATDHGLLTTDIKPSASASPFLVFQISNHFSVSNLERSAPPTYNGIAPCFILDRTTADRYATLHNSGCPSPLSRQSLTGRYV